MSNIFGSDPASLDGVDFFNGTASSGMIVFKTAGTFSITPSEVGNVKVLVVAGGGAGGASTGGGGGAGGLFYNSALALTPVAITVMVGDKGLPGNDSATISATNGGNSVFASMTAIGGGRGGYWKQAGAAGGSGGGGGGRTSMAGGAGTSLQGNNGGAAQSGDVAGHNAGGGGGGSNTVGITASDLAAGNGGQGKEYFGFWYAGGGGGGVSATGTVGTGHSGGGNGALGDYGQSAVVNTGSGGGGGGESKKGGDGAVGIIIVQWGDYDANYDPTTDIVQRNFFIGDFSPTFSLDIVKQLLQTIQTFEPEFNKTLSFDLLQQLIETTQTFNVGDFNKTFSMELEKGFIGTLSYDLGDFNITSSFGFLKTLERILVIGSFDATFTRTLSKVDSVAGFIQLVNHFLVGKGLKIKFNLNEINDIVGLLYLNNTIPDYQTVQNSLQLNNSIIVPINDSIEMLNKITSIIQGSLALKNKVSEKTEISSTISLINRIDPQQEVLDYFYLSEEHLG